LGQSESRVELRKKWLRKTLASIIVQPTTHDENMPFFSAGCNIDTGFSLVQRVHPKYRPVFEKLSEADRAAVTLYFLPHGSKKEVLEVARPRVVKWYCPFADQREFPSGSRVHSSSGIHGRSRPSG
jgi:hypothetical protein